MTVLFFSYFVLYWLLSSQNYIFHCLLYTSFYPLQGLSSRFAAGKGGLPWFPGMWTELTQRESFTLHCSPILFVGIKQNKTKECKDMKVNDPDQKWWQAFIFLPGFQSRIPGKLLTLSFYSQNILLECERTLKYTHDEWRKEERKEYLLR